MFAKIFKANPYRDELGRFSTKDGAALARSNPVDIDALAPLVDYIKAKGGFTYQPLKKYHQTTGFSVSPYPELSWATDAEHLTTRDIVAYAIKNRSMFMKENHFFGAWHDTETGRIYLDVSIVQQTHAAATQTCLDKDQIAYFDLDKGVTIDVNRNATSGGAAKVN